MSVEALMDTHGSIALTVGQTVFLRDAETRKAAVAQVERIEWLPAKRQQSAQPAQHEQVEMWVRVRLLTGYYDWTAEQGKEHLCLPAGSSIGVPAYRLEAMRS
jgi:hypothetical protein